MHYALVAENSQQELADEISKMLREGWVLYGSPAVSAYVNANGETYVVYAQAMTSEED